jgi:hypothetical protein
MKIKNLVSWAGDTFSHAPGDVVEVDEGTAYMRIAEGLAEPVEELAPALEEALQDGKKRKR